MRYKYFERTKKKNSGTKVCADCIFKSAEFETDENGIEFPIQDSIIIIGKNTFTYDRSPVTDKEILSDSIQALELVETSLTIHPRYLNSNACLEN